MEDRTDNAEKPFLEAEWSNLCIVTYPVPPEILEERVPEPLELDTRNGNAFASLVAFDFQKTKVWRVGWPGFRSFPEVNLRFYVRHGDRRGVMFIREFVPQPFVAWMAGVFFGEPYEALPMESEVRREDGLITVDHQWTHGGTIQRLELTAEEESSPPEESSDAYYFSDHRWGFGRDGDDETIVYEVQHPLWETHPVTSLDIDVDWDEVYGHEWDVLRNRDPVSVVLAKGSPVRVFSKEPLAP